MFGSTPVVAGLSRGGATINITNTTDEKAKYFVWRKGALGLSRGHIDVWATGVKKGGCLQLPQGIVQNPQPKLFSACSKRW